MKTKAALCLLAMITIHVHAQETVNVGLFSSVIIPSKELKEAVDNSLGGTGAGFGGHVLFNPNGKKRHSPIFLGADFLYTTFGRDKQSGTPPYKTSFNYYYIKAATRIFSPPVKKVLHPLLTDCLALKYSIHGQK